MSIIPTIKDTQIAIKIYQDSLRLGGMSVPNGQSALLKSFINTLSPDHINDILSLPPTTLITTLSSQYKLTVVNIQPYLQQTILPEVLPEYTVKSIDKLNEYKFSIHSKENTLYKFDLRTVSQDIVDRINISQKIKLYNNNDILVGEGIIWELIPNYFLVKTKNKVDNIAYATIQTIIYSNIDYSSQWVSDVCFNDSAMPSWIHVKILNTRKLYNCSWGLYYKSKPTSDPLTVINPEYLVAKGTDNIQPGYAYLSKSNATFKQGLYILKSRVVKYGNYSTSYKLLKWEILEERSFLKNE